MIAISFLLLLLLSFCIAEFFGRSKHIGRWWTFALSLTGFIVVGIIACLFSPSAKRKTTKGHIAHLIVGVLIAIHGVLTFIMFSVQAEPVGISQAIAFMCLGSYLIVLSGGKVVNDDPKYYFTLPDISRTITSDSTDFLYYVREDDNNSEPKTFEELKVLKIKENTPVWRKGLEKWVLAKDLQELESIILHEPPVFEEPKVEVVVEEVIVAPPPFIEKDNSQNKSTPPEFKSNTF